MSCREYVKATVKVTLTGPDGKVLKVIEGEKPDPFGYSVLNFMLFHIGASVSSSILFDPIGHEYYYDLVTPSPSTSLGYLVFGFCLANCPNAGFSPPNGIGMWLFNEVPGVDYTDDWAFYRFLSEWPSNLITGLSYSPLSVSPGISSPSSPGDIVYYLLYATQSITNTLSSPVNVYTIAFVGAVYGSRSASPVYVPITFYVFTPPIVLSPGVTMTVSVTLSFPYGIAIGPG